MSIFRYLLVILLTLPSFPVLANHPTDLDYLLKQLKQAQQHEAAVRKAREKEFLSVHADKKALLNKVKTQLAEQRRHSETLKAQFDDNEKSLQVLQEKLDQRTGDLGELFGTVRQTANDLSALISESLVSAQYPHRAEWFDDLANAKKLPDINELERFWLLIQQEIKESGKVSRFTREVVGSDGLASERRVVRVGVFSVFSGDSFLRYLPESGELLELYPQPEARFRRKIAEFALAGPGHASVVIDPTRGDLLDLLIQKPGLVERLQQAGSIGYLIIAVGIFGLLLVIQRFTSLSITSRRMKRQLADIDQANDNNPLGRVLLAAREQHGKSMELIETVLDEAILRETPALKRSLNLLKLLVAVAPLMGLLGTVTGMILTFQSISLFGTGDPKLMAGGISQALMTTVLGLVVAIPLLFMHTLLASRSRGLIQILDEQSAGVVASQVRHHD